MQDRIDMQVNWEQWNRRFGQLGGAFGWVIIVVVLVVWAATGMYTVGPSEVALVKRFGKSVGQTGPGFHYHLPKPIESVVLVDHRSVRTEEIGFRSRTGVPSTKYQGRTEEALMLTGDFNIIRLEAVVQYDITNSETFAFEVEDYRTIIRQAAQAVIREKVALRSVDDALTEKKSPIIYKKIYKIFYSNTTLDSESSMCGCKK